jgi:hypothetical protein
VRESAYECVVCIFLLYSGYPSLTHYTLSLSHYTLLHCNTERRRTCLPALASRGPPVQEQEKVKSQVGARANHLECSVCMCICMCGFKYVCLSSCGSFYRLSYTYTHAHTHTHTHTHTHSYSRAVTGKTEDDVVLEHWVKHTNVPDYRFARANKVGVCMCVYVCACACMCVYACASVSVCV